MAHGKDAARDLRFGRRGGRWASEPTPVAWHEVTPCVAEPDDDSLRAHLVEHHGMPASVVDGHEPPEWATWHHAEHRTRHPRARERLHGGHLRHTHPQYLPKSEKRKAA